MYTKHFGIQMNMYFEALSFYDFIILCYKCFQKINPELKQFFLKNHTQQNTFLNKRTKFVRSFN